MKICDVAICHRPFSEESKLQLCQRHENALQNLDKTYSGWIKAYGKQYNKKKYYLTLITNEELKTGKWVREVINHLMEEEVSS